MYWIKNPLTTRNPLANHEKFISDFSWLKDFYPVHYPTVGTCLYIFIRVKYGRMQKKISSVPVSVWQGSSHRWAGIFFCVQVIYVIMKIVTPCFNRPSLLSRSLVGQCTGQLNWTVSPKFDSILAYRVTIGYTN